MIAAFINGKGQHSAKLIWAYILIILKKRFNYAKIHLDSTRLNWMLNQPVYERKLEVASISKFFFTQPLKEY